MALLSIPGGIGRRILLIFLIPMLLVGLGLGYRLTTTHLQEAQQALEIRGRLVARQLAVISEFSLFAENVDELYRQAVSIAQENDVVHVEIQNAAGILLAEAGVMPGGADAARVISFSAPVLRSSVAVSDFEEDLPEPSATDPEAPLGLVQVSLSTSRLERHRDSILFTGILLTAGGLVASFLLALLVARSVSVPVIRLTETVRNLTGGNLSARAQTGSPGELGTLEEGINQMAGALEDARQELVHEVEEATAALQETVRKLEQRNQDLEQARQEALRAGHAKSDFLARMSHEIRTPLSAVIGFSRLLDNTDLSDTQTEYIHTISQAASQLLVVIDDILGYTRLESTTPEVEHITFDLHDSLENVVSMLGAAAHQKQLELVLYIHSDVPRSFSGDPKRISQVTTNLLSNAIKFTESGHVIIEVAVQDADDRSITVNFTVTDTGVGIGREQLEHIFDPFVQADASTSRRFGGTGLGLSICRKLVELMDGDISADSAPGKGSSFSFSLTSPVIQPPDDSSPPRVLAGQRVLIHDSNPFTLRALRNRFFTWGADVFYTPSRERMLSMISPQATQEQPFTLLVAGLAPTQHRTQAIDEMLALVREQSGVPVLLLVNGEIPGLFTIPGTLPDSVLLSKPARSNRLLRAVHNLLRLDAPASPVQPASAGQQAPGLQGIHVLLAEDNTFNQQLLKHMLSELDVRVTLATNGSEACALAENTRFDAILMDIHMPVMGGISATRQIRKGPNSRTPMIALTADVFADQDHYFGSLGIDACLYKPVTPQQLARTLSRWTGMGGTTAGNTASEAVVLPAGFRKRLLEELRDRLQAIRTATHAGNIPQAREQLHMLKGMVDYFGLAAFKETFNSLQQAVHSGTIAELEALLGRMDTLLEQQRDSTTEE